MGTRRFDDGNGPSLNKGGSLPSLGLFLASGSSSIHANSFVLALASCCELSSAAGAFATLGIAAGSAKEIPSPIGVSQSPSDAYALVREVTRFKSVHFACLGNRSCPLRVMTNYRRARFE
jgi:hypothetical protein